ncbi:hypothetical protein N8987_04325 [Crocinitomix sp.]|nr:hypothetical protein [Crocinitomix sp.]
MKILNSYHPALLALESLNEQFPGVLSLSVFCNDGGIAAYNQQGAHTEDFIPQNIVSETNRIKIQKFRQLKKEVFWGDEDDLPISSLKSADHGKTIKQLSIQDEIEQNYLIFRIPSHTDDAYDVFSIEFSKSFSNFYIQSGRNALSSELKVSIGKTIRNQVLWIYNLHKKQSTSIQRIQHAYLQNEDELDEVQNELDREKANNRELLERYLTQIIHAKEIELDTKIQIKKGFLDKIIQNDIGIEHIKPVVEAAVLTAHDLSMDKSVIQLSANLILAKPSNTINSDKSTQLIALDKTHALLDRYELAARQLTDQNRKVNGKNLANILEISGPAITDAIKKHNGKIAKLIEKYPNNWPLICDYIRPLQEIKWKIALSG